ncbi:hypothetical protein Lal_00022314 [Lupinus albus]|nr:hypothetical protein Lal_00022314 [Lupinus albus]
MSHYGENHCNMTCKPSKNSSVLEFIHLPFSFHSVLTDMFRDLCLCGKASLEFIYSTWDCSPTFASSQKAETDFTMDLAPCYIKTEGKDSIMSIEDPCNSEKIFLTNYWQNSLSNLEVIIETCVKLIGLRLSSLNFVLTASFLFCIFCWFPKKTTHKLQVQVTAEEYGAKEKSSIFTYSSRDILSPEIASIIRLKERSVFFNYRYFDNKLIKTEVTNDFSCPADQVINVSIKPEVLEVITSGPKNCFSLLKIVGDLNPRQVFILRNARLCKRQFYHSVKYQPMSLEKVISDDDSEGEIDEETKDIEHRKLTEKCEGVTKEEKEIMFLWSSFIRRQRQSVVRLSHSLGMCWRMLMIKLWKHNLIDGEVMNDCSVILEKYLKQNSDSPT